MRQGQVYCGKCDLPIGFTDQKAARVSTTGAWLCPFHKRQEEMAERAIYRPAEVED